MVQVHGLTRHDQENGVDNSGSVQEDEGEEEGSRTQGRVRVPVETEGREVHSLLRLKIFSHIL